jgi:bacillopeptidase F (M6 metalloprotease family)
MTLTRAFDFGNVSGEILFEYWTWYHIEEDYDYLYLEASIDGGQTWNILTTPSGTNEDPSGNSYGWAYNGKSGVGESPVWIHELVDLSAFAGDEVMLRFEYITDTALNTEGFLLDDLKIEALGYHESFENGDGGWEAQGFVRMSNRVPQGYKVALIERGEGINVREIEIDSSGLAEIKLVFDDEIEDVILVIAGTSRHSWIPAEYIIEIVE